MSADGVVLAWRASCFAGLRASEAQLLQHIGSGAYAAAFAFGRRRSGCFTSRGFSRQASALWGRRTRASRRITPKTSVARRNCTRRATRRIAVR